MRSSPAVRAEFSDPDALSADRRLRLLSPPPGGIPCPTTGGEGRVRARERDSGNDSAVAAPLPAAGARRESGTPATLGAVPSQAAMGPRQLLALQNSAGNAATARLLGPRAHSPAGAAGLAPVVEESDDPDVIRRVDAGGRPLPDRRPGARRTPRRPRPGPRQRGEAFGEAPSDGPEHPPLVLPPYLLDMTSAGLSTASDLRGHEFVGHAVGRATGAADEQTAVIRQELAGRPETFYGAGRAFSVQGKEEPWDVTVSVSRDLAREPSPMLFKSGAPEAPEIPASAGLEDPATKVDQLHTSSGAVGADAVRARQLGLSASGTLLVPAAPGVWAGAQFAASGALTSTHDAHTTRTAAEPRTLRSAGGSVRAPRQVTYTVRVVRQDAPGPAQAFTGAGSLTMRVPREHLVPLGTDRPAPGPALTPAQSRAVRLATSTAAISVEDAGAPHRGGWRDCTARSAPVSR